MRQDVFLIGNDLRRLVPFSLAFRDRDYAVTLAETADALGRARDLTGEPGAWLLVFLSGAEMPGDCLALRALAPHTIFVAPEASGARRLPDCDAPSPTKTSR